jgi:hypothetical protein
LNEGRRKKEEGRRRFIYVDSDKARLKKEASILQSCRPKSKRKTLRKVGILNKTARMILKLVIFKNIYIKNRRLAF